MVSGVAGAAAGLAEPPIAASVISGDAVIAWEKIVLLLDVVLVDRDLCLICPDCICLLERLRVLAAELVAVLLLFCLEPWCVEHLLSTVIVPLCLSLMSPWFGVGFGRPAAHLALVLTVPALPISAPGGGCPAPPLFGRFQGCLRKFLAFEGPIWGFCYEIITWGA
jgi:hypothetical protein